MSFQKLFYALAFCSLFVLILILAKSILIPIAFALLFSFILFPLTKKFEKWGIGTAISVFLSLGIVCLAVTAFLFFFSSKLLALSSEFTLFQDKIVFLFASAIEIVNEKLKAFPNFDKNGLFADLKGNIANMSASLISQTFNGTTAFLTGISFVAVYTFLFLIYRKTLVKALSSFADESNRPKVVKMFQNIQQLGQKYLWGLMLLTFVIGMANSIGLWIIGIEHPFLFGFLGAFLSIVPYLGTTIGAVLPMLYAFVSFDSYWMVFAVGALFLGIQLLSDNFLSPKIVGNSIHVNAFAAIMCLIVGAVVWGIAGMVLFLPFTAILKVISDEFDTLKPIGMLLGNDDEGEGQVKQRKTKWWKKIKNG